MLNGLFAGLDVSTQSCKLVVIQPETGCVVHVDVVHYDDDLPHYDTHQGVTAGLGVGVSESDPLMWIEAVEMVLGRMEKSEVDVSQVRCLCVSGQQHALVALDAAGNLARSRAKLWNDCSTLAECALLTDAVGGAERMIQEVGNSQRTGYTASKILHLRRHEPEAFERATILFLAHNYINWWLSDGIAAMEPGDTSGTALWNPQTRAYSEAVLSAIDDELAAKLPPIRPSDQTIGPVGRHLVERFGFSPDCRVGAGSGDNMYGAIGTGNVTPGVVTISLGTSGTAYSVTDTAWVDPTGQIASFCDSTGRYLPLLCVSNMANGYDAVRRTFDLSHEDFTGMVMRTPAGNDGRLLIPWFEGERTPDLPLATPLYLGFAVDDFNAERMTRAVLEGHVLNLHAGFDRWPVQPTRLHLTGGLAQSSAWCQTIADIFEIETVPVLGEGAALGAALHAAWVWGKETGADVTLVALTDVFVEFSDNLRCSPKAEAVAAHRIQRDFFSAVSGRIRGLESADPFAIRTALMAFGQQGPGRPIFPA
jgi:xylulokinase